MEINNIDECTIIDGARFEMISPMRDISSQDMKEALSKYPDAIVLGDPDRAPYVLHKITDQQSGFCRSTKAYQSATGLHVFFETQQYNNPSIAATFEPGVGLESYEYIDYKGIQRVGKRPVRLPMDSDQIFSLACRMAGKPDVDAIKKWHDVISRAYDQISNSPHPL